MYSSRGGLDWLHGWLCLCAFVTTIGSLRASIELGNVKSELKAATAKAEEWKQKTMDQQLELMKFKGMAERCGAEKWYEE